MSAAKLAGFFNLTEHQRVCRRAAAIRALNKLESDWRDPRVKMTRPEYEERGVMLEYTIVHVSRVGEWSPELASETGVQSRLDEMGGDEVRS